MSFIDDWRVMVKKSSCNPCRSDLRQKIIEDTFPKKYKDSKGWTKPEYNEEWKKHWEEKRHILIKAEKEIENKICFVFRADCGGDGISLCKKHLQEIIQKIEEMEK